MKKHRYHIMALILSLIMITGSLSGSVFAAETSGETAGAAIVEGIEETDKSETVDEEESQVNENKSEQVDEKLEEITQETEGFLNEEKQTIPVYEEVVDDIDQKKVEEAAYTEETSAQEEETVINRLVESESVWTDGLETYVEEDELTVYSNSLFYLEGYAESDSLISRIITGQEKTILDYSAMEIEYDYDGILYREQFVASMPGEAIIEVYNPDTNQVFRRTKVTVLQNSGEIIACKGRRIDISFYDCMAWAGNYPNPTYVGLEADESLNIRARGANYLEGNMDVEYENYVCLTPTKVGNYIADFISYRDRNGNAITNIVYRLNITVVDHDYSEWKVTKEETCVYAGTRERVCSLCGEKLIEEIPATGHIWNEDYTVDQEATCTEEGSESIHCSVCGVIDEESVRAIPKKEHAYGDWIVTKEATCTEDGSQKKACVGCGDKVTEEIPATGHIWNEDYTVDQEATCTEEGSESIHCSVCNEIKVGSPRSISKLDHAYGNWEMVTEPTCTKEGSRKKVCAECGDTATETIPATGHMWNEEYTVDKEATYTEEGSESIHCSTCGEIKEGTSRPIARLLKPMSMLTVSGIVDKTYTGNALTQSPAVKDGSITLKEGIDYNVSYKNNINAGTATVTFTGKGNYTGTKTVTFKINKAAQNIAIKVSAASIAVGKTSTISITGNKGTKSYKSSNTAVAAINAAGTVTAKKVGTVTITATSAATANYNTACKAVKIKVVPAATSSITAANQATGINLTWKKVAGATGYKVYRGATLIKTIKSGATVTCTDTKANTNGTKYTFKIVPTASTGNGTAKSLTTYRVARPDISSVKNTAAKKMTVSWKKNARANGYQIQYSTNKKFASGNKTANVTKTATVSKVIGSLTKGKTYYVRIRTYKTVGKTKYWSAWSSTKTVKISK